MWSTQYYSPPLLTALSIKAYVWTLFQAAHRSRIRTERVIAAPRAN